MSHDKKIICNWFADLVLSCLGGISDFWGVQVQAYAEPLLIDGYTACLAHVFPISCVSHEICSWMFSSQETLPSFVRFAIPIVPVSD